MTYFQKTHKFFNWFISGAAVMGLLLTVACGSSGGGGGGTGTPLQGLASCTAQAGSSVICGTVYAADGATPVAGATISQVSGSALVVSSLSGLTHDGLGALTPNPDACLTDDVGAFACLVSGSGALTFQLTGSIFGTTPQQFTATTTEGETTDIPAADTTASTTSTQWLVIPGSFDGIQLLLAQLKGCTLTGDVSDPPALRGSTECEGVGLKVLDDTDVATQLQAETLSNYQAVFANCDADVSFDADVTTALQNYVNGGGNMYFSDLSDSWLTAVFPGLITFAGNATDDSPPNLTAVVVDTGLQMFLGSTAAPQTTMDIEFDWNVWTAMTSVDASGWTTYVQGDITPLAPTYTGTRPITVGGPQGSGCVFYTSYHVEGAGTAGADQEKALRYLVLNRMNNCTQ